MSQVPRYYREQQLMREAYKGIQPEARGLMDVSEVQAIKRAVQLKLNEQDGEYARRQDARVQEILRKLS